MNFFDFFKIPVSFYPDQEDLRSKYLANSKAYHPDIYQGDDPVEAMEKIAINNKGFTTLSKPDKTADYILKEVYPPEGKAELPQSFLMEMMDVNEAVMELQFEEDESKKAQIAADVTELEESLRSEMETLAKAFNTENTGDLENIRTAQLKLKYTRRLKESLKS